MCRELISRYNDCYYIDHVIHHAWIRCEASRNSPDLEPCYDVDWLTLREKDALHARAVGRLLYTCAECDREREEARLARSRRIQGMRERREREVNRYVQEALKMMDDDEKADRGEGGKEGEEEKKKDMLEMEVDGGEPREDMLVEMEMEIEEGGCGVGEKEGEGEARKEK
jgi:hypothetical protein